MKLLSTDHILSLLKLGLPDEKDSGIKEAFQKIPLKDRRDDNDCVSITINRDGIGDEVEVICEMEVDEPWEGDDGKHPATAWVKESVEFETGEPIKLSELEQERAVNDFWEVQERKAREHDENEH